MILSKLIMFNVQWNEYDDTANGKDNVVRPEWISMFPSVHTLNVKTEGKWYKFRLEALLESMQSISSSITVTVDDKDGIVDYRMIGSWIQSALTDEIVAAFDAAGWNIEYEEEGGKYGDGRLVIKSKGQ